jgi:hypothetical protein
MTAGLTDRDRHVQSLTRGTTNDKGIRVKRLAATTALVGTTLAALGTVAVDTASALPQQAAAGYPCEWENVDASRILHLT